MNPSNVHAAGVLLRQSGDPSKAVLFLALLHSERGLCLPCGKLLPGETPFEAAQREVGEETPFDVVVEPDNPFLSTDVEGHDVMTFSGVLANFKPVRTVDAREGIPVWVTAFDLANLDHRYATYNRAVLTHFGIKFD